jgi:hypothetical protein
MRAILAATITTSPARRSSRNSPTRRAVLSILVFADDHGPFSDDPSRLRIGSQRVLRLTRLADNLHPGWTTCDSNPRARW